MSVWQTLKNFKNVEKLVFRWDPDKISLQDLFCAGYMLCEMVVREEETQVFTFRDENWLKHDQTIRLKNPETRIVRHWYLLRHSWRKRENTFSDSWNREHHWRVGFWVQAPESDWARGWQKYGEESCNIIIQMMAKNDGVQSIRMWMNCLHRRAFSTSASRSIWDRLMFSMRQGFRAKCYHFVNCEVFRVFNMVFNMLKPFLTPEVRDGVVFHSGNLATLRSMCVQQVDCNNATWVLCETITKNCVVRFC